VSGTLLDGSTAIARAMIAAGCRFFAGYPMTPFTEVLECMARELDAVGGSCVNAESELEAIGMAWGAAVTGTRAATGSTGQGLSLMQESIAELALAQVPLVVLNMARGQSDYFQATRGGGHGDYRTPVLAPCDVGEATTLVQHAFHLADTWRSPVLVMGDYYLAHTMQSIDVRPIDFGELPAKDWALDGSSGGSGAAKLVSPLGTAKQRHDVGYDLAEHHRFRARETARMLAAIEPLCDHAYLDDADVVVVAYGTPARYVGAAVEALRRDGVRVGWFRPITLLPFPSAELASSSEGCRRVAVYENSQGQMIDDVRLAVRDRVPTEFIGGLSLDSSGFGIGPELDVEIVRRRIEDVVMADGARP
jgi:2-oxoglutarate ferredoxin oxidoreductase subunit alpha